MTRLQRYCLYQIPGVALVAALTAAAVRWFSLPAWTVGVSVAVWVAKDCAMYPLVKAAYEGAKPTGPESLLGSLGTAAGDLLPQGLVKIGPELWSAECSVPARSGQIVRVTGCDGMTMRVEPVPTDEPGTGGKQTAERDAPRRDRNRA